MRQIERCCVCVYEQQIANISSSEQRPLFKTVFVPTEKFRAYEQEKFAPSQHWAQLS
jgi:hypothetical protein